MHDAQISIWDSLHDRVRLHSHFGGYALQPRTRILEKSQIVEVSSSLTFRRNRRARDPTAFTD